MGASHQRSSFARIAHRYARVVVCYTVLFSLCSVMLPKNGIAQQAESNPALPSFISAKPTEIENATNIRAQPLALLAKFPDAGPAMARFVAQQLTQQPAMIDAMLSIVNDTSPAQASAMGAGMVRAARMIAARQPSASRAITEKVMRSDNKWLTTTYASLGPRYNGSGVFVAPAGLPPREALAGADMGEGIGAAWRMGPAENVNYAAPESSGNTPNGGQKCFYDADGYLDSHCRGMIVAVMKSDASHNGAVSTSPTI